jgi:replicative DNA helicase
MSDVHSIESEQALIGAILINNDAFNVVADKVRPDDFFEPVHATIFGVCADLIRSGKRVTPVTLGVFLPPVEVAGLSMQQYIARLAAEATTVINAADYAGLIRDMADTRRIASVAETLASAGPQNPAEVAGQGIEALDAIVASRTATGAPSLTMGQAVSRAIDAAATAYQREGRLSGISWGLQELDAMTLGLQRCELVVLAGRPGMGKSAMGLCVTRTAAKQGHPSIFFSLEMGDIPLTQRMLADEMFDEKPIAYWLLRAGKFSEQDFQRMTEAAIRIGELPLRIEQQPALTVAQISARARQAKRRGALDLIVVDHLHLVRASERYSGNRVQEIGEVTSGLKALAKELDCAVLALCQLNRGLEGRDDKRPSLSDLRGSGNIEEDADTVAMLYRESYYLERRKPPESDADEFAQWLARMEASSNKLDAIIEKQRNGPIGTVKLFCNIGCNAVRTLARQDGLAL